MHEIKLHPYRADVGGFQSLKLGTKDSYGIEQLKIVPGSTWAGLVITATFSHAGKALADPVLVPDDGIISVPPGATASVLTENSPGVIVFRGVADGVQRISADVKYTCAGHGPVDGTAPDPEPSVYEQFIAQVKDNADRAEKAADDAEAALENLSGQAERAEAAADRAAQSETNAAASATAAAGSAADAAAELAKVQGAGTAALTAIGNAQTTAVGEVQTAQTTATQAVEQAGTTQVGAVNTAGQAQKTAIQQAGEDATKQVQDAGTEQVKAVNAAGDAKLAEIQEVNALLPTPTEADAGKAVVVKHDGSGYELGTVSGGVDAYTKAESDARYAPIEAAIKVSCKGTGLVSLSPTVAWQPQGLRLFGQAWQDGTPSVENPVPIQNAGQDGTVNVTACGANFLKIPDGEFSRIGITISNKDGVQVVSGTASGTGDLRTISFTVPASGKYKARSSGNINSRLFENGSIRSNNQNIDYFLDCQAGDEITMSIYVTSGVTYNSEKVYQWITAGEADMPFTPYVEPQLLPVSTPDGLPGIPVNSGGNWVDETGQAWVSDVVDLVAGTLTRHYGQIASYNSEEINTPYISSTGALTTGAQVVYALSEPITTPLDSDTIAAYRALTSYPGTTNVLAPDCGIEAAAVGDANAILESITTRIAALEQNAVGGTT